MEDYVSTHIRLEKEQYDHLRDESHETRRSQSDIVREALEFYWKGGRRMTVAEAWLTLEPYLDHGTKTTEYLVKIKNGHLIQYRNLQGRRQHLTRIGGAISLIPSPDLKDTDWVGVNRNPETILAN